MNLRRAKLHTLAMSAAMLMLVGLWQLGAGAWVYVKAKLAQVLLQRAWAHTLTGERHVKPWPWADTWPVARLRAPAQDADLIVLAGANGRTLAFGPGHVESSAPPGKSGSTLLTAHRDTHFAFLARLRPGDSLIVQTPDGKEHRYVVRETRIVDSRTASLRAESDQPALVLVTCYPFDAIVPGGPLRYVVTATAIEDTSKAIAVIPVSVPPDGAADRGPAAQPKLRPPM